MAFHNSLIQEKHLKSFLHGFLQANLTSKRLTKPCNLKEQTYPKSSSDQKYGINKLFVGVLDSNDGNRGDNYHVQERGGKPDKPAKLKKKRRKTVAFL